ncbi:MAG: serine acetyltransferase [Clostridia bacterium]|nr:serine acetyltransferase [Clostridia bacterium]
MNKDFRYDFYRNTGFEFKFNLKTLETLLFSHNIKFLSLLRKAQAKPSLFKKIRLKKYALKYGLEISSQAKIGKGLYLGHPYNITVSYLATLGDNVNLHKGCTIGAENRGARKGAPKIGNCVYVGINSTVIGNITIGDDVLIAPNSFVNFDVPAHSVVVGNPAKIHPKENATDGYIAFRV